MNAPKVGDRVDVRGVACEVFKVHPLGTVDVVSLDGAHAWRVSGLGLSPAAPEPADECPWCHDTDCTCEDFAPDDGPDCSDPGDIGDGYDSDIMD